MVLWRGWYGTLKRVVWYFEEGGVVLWRGWYGTLKSVLMVNLPHPQQQVSGRFYFFFRENGDYILIPWRVLLAPYKIAATFTRFATIFDSLKRHNIIFLYQRAIACKPGAWLSLSKKMRQKLWHLSCVLQRLNFCIFLCFFRFEIAFSNGTYTVQ